MTHQTLLINEQTELSTTFSLIMYLF